MANVCAGACVYFILYIVHGVCWTSRQEELYVLHGHLYEIAMDGSQVIAGWSEFTYCLNGVSICFLSLESSPETRNLEVSGGAPLAAKCVMGFL